MKQTSSLNGGNRNPSAPESESSPTRPSGQDDGTVRGISSKVITFTGQIEEITYISAGSAGREIGLKHLSIKEENLEFETDIVRGGIEDLSKPLKKPDSRGSEQPLKSKFGGILTPSWFASEGREQHSELSEEGEGAG